MLKSIWSVAAAMAILASAAWVYANCGKCGSKAAGTEKCAAGACASEKCTSETCGAAQASASQGCPIAAAMERLPKLTYAVGEKETCCPKEAAKLATDSGGHVHYCVAGKEYDTESEAQTALVEATEKFVAAFTQPQKCSRSGQVTLGGQAQTCEKTAGQTAKLMNDAMAKVKFTFVVGDKQCSCPIEAAKLAEESGQPKTFVVGEEKTCCEKTARLNLARAKYKAAVKTLVEAGKKAASAESSQET